LGGSGERGGESVTLGVCGGGGGWRTKKSKTENKGASRTCKVQDHHQAREMADTLKCQEEKTNTSIHTLESTILRTPGDKKKSGHLSGASGEPTNEVPTPVLTSAETVV